MKKFSIKWILSICLFVAFSSQISAQAVIWGYATDSLNSSFKGGLNGWTTTGISSEDPTKAANAKWVWTATGRLSNGAYWGTNAAIASPTVGNGAAGFNSDFLDNGGVAGAFGLGTCPSVHKGELVSPTISCAGRSSVEIKFNQYFRNFNADCTVSASNDGGTTWTNFIVNAGIATNAATPTNDVQFVDISAVAANKANVKIKFTFDGEYYFWLIDDVELREKPNNNLALGAVNFGPSSYSTPKSQIGNDTFQFVADVKNIGKLSQTNVSLKAEIFKRNTNGSNGALIYRDSQLIGTIVPNIASIAGSILDGATVKDTSFVLDKLFAPGTALNAVGDYNLVYSLRSLDSLDTRPADNVKTLRFNISDFNWQKDNGSPSGSGRSNNGSDYAIGCVYKTSPNWFGSSYVARSVAFGAFIPSTQPAGTTVNGLSTTFFVAKVADNILPNYDNFNTATAITAGNPDLTLVGSGSFEFTNLGGNDTTNAEVQLTDFDSGDPDIILEKDKRYFVVANYSDASAKLAHYISTGYKNYNIQTVVYLNEWFTGFADASQAVLKMTIALGTFTDVVALPDNVMSIYPLPANTEIAVDLNFEKSSNLNVALVDIKGQILDMQDVNDVTKSTLRYDVSKYPSGTYLIRVECKDGTKTKRFVVQH